MTVAHESKSGRARRPLKRQTRGGAAFNGSDALQRKKTAEVKAALRPHLLAGTPRGALTAAAGSEGCRGSRNQRTFRIWTRIRILKFIVQQTSRPPAPHGTVIRPSQRVEALVFVVVTLRLRAPICRGVAPAPRASQPGFHFTAAWEITRLSISGACFHPDGF